MNRPFFLPAFLSLFVAVAAAQEPADPAKERKPERVPVADVTVELRCVTLPPEVAVPLIRKFRSEAPADKTAAATELDALLVNGTAKLVGWPLVTTHSGVKATDEAVQEIRYAQTFDAGHNTIYISDQDGDLRPEPPPAIVADHEPLPAQFNQKEVGVKFEVLPMVSDDGKSVGLILTAQHIRLQSIDRITIEHEHTTEKKTEKVTVEQPRFSTVKVGTELTMDHGEQRVIGIFKVPGEERQLELFVLGVEIHDKK